MRYLVDTSALVRMVRRQVDPQWFELAGRGLIAICDPVLVETLTIADAKAYDRVERGLRDVYPWVPVPDDAWQVVRAVRQELASQSAHQGLSVADHLVIATAIRLKLVVLHQDADYETVARFVPQLSQERIA
ncbi:PIN domain-containing protein [Micromonospora sp. WMMD998]|uniref:PIN domain-containing protein n=1 Tax=Micromonospora sp. WMMD998 TaxID=3016092 RepID=UPI00249A0916|nr:PIN domain-containing protein [Micromonospora sp. WMMD998]WFE39630.1 PIN domain-containing protein [Micromonospora sp. WMMD998]